MTPRMARELPTNPYRIQPNVPPLPLPQIPDPYAMRFARPYEDAEMLSVWMNRPHLVQTWGCNWESTRWRIHLTEQLSGTYSRPYIISLRGEDFLYFELFRAARDVLSNYYQADPHDVGLHGAVADPAMVAKGHGRYAFHYMADAVFGADPQCRRIIGDTPTSADADGRRFWQHIGGTLVGEPYITEWKWPRAIFAWPRTPDDVPRLQEARSAGNGPATVPDGTEL